MSFFATLPPWLPIMVGGLGLTVFVSYINSRHQRQIASRIEQVAGATTVLETVEPTRPRSSFLPTLRKWLTAQAMTERVQHDLDGAGISLRAEEFIIIVGATTFFMFLATLLLLGNPVVAAVMGLLGYFGSWRLVRYARRRRQRRLEVQLADALTLIASSLRSGHTAVQSMEVATQQLPPPISEEFGRVIFNANIGVPIGDAMNQMAARVQSYEYDMMVSALTIQLEVGGSITELLDSIADTIRDRATLRDEMHALTAQGRLSGLLLSAMPVGLFFLTMITNRDYGRLLLDDPLGQTILKVCIAMEIIGWMIIRKILNVRV